MYCLTGSRASAISDGWPTADAETYSLCAVACSNIRSQQRTQQTRLKHLQSGDVLSVAGPCMSLNNSAPLRSTSSRYPPLTPRKPPTSSARIGCPFTLTVHVCMHHQQHTSDIPLRASFPPPTPASAPTTISAASSRQCFPEKFSGAGRLENP